MERGMWYNVAIILKCRWCDVFVLNVNDPTDDKIDDVKASLYEELEREFNKFPKYCMKISLDFSAKVGKEDTYMPIIGHATLHGNGNVNKARTQSFGTGGKMGVQ
jgi:hypothetical protein